MDNISDKIVKIAFGFTTVVLISAISTIKTYRNEIKSLKLNVEKLKMINELHKLHIDE
jgi:hypothetical protein